MFSGQDEIPDYLTGPTYNCINSEELNLLGRYFNSESGQSEKDKRVDQVSPDNSAQARQSLNRQVPVKRKDDKIQANKINTEIAQKDIQPKTNVSQKAPTRVGTNKSKAAKVNIDQQLPSDINQNFSRWLYGDLSAFAPGSTKKKQKEDERTPKQKLLRKRKKKRLLLMQQQKETERQLELTRCQQDSEKQINENNNEISPSDIKYLTQEIDINEMQPIDEILTPIIRVDHSAPKGEDETQSVPVSESQIVSDANSLERTQNNRGTTTKDKLTVTLTVERTIVDRRPMFKKLGTLGRASTNRHEVSNEISSTSLIAPGEDCDDSEDYEFEEITC